MKFITQVTTLALVWGGLSVFPSVVALPHNVFSLHAAEESGLSERSKHFLQELSEHERELSSLGFRFEKGEFDFDHMRRVRRKQGDKFSWIKGEVKIEIYTRLVQAFLDFASSGSFGENSGENNGDKLENYRKILKITEDQEKFLQVMKEGSNGFLEYCRGESENEAAIQFSQYVAKEIAEGKCEDANENLVKREDLTLYLDQMDFPLTDLSALKEAKKMTSLQLLGDEDHPGKEVVKMNVFQTLGHLSHWKTLKINHAKLDFSQDRSMPMTQNLKVSHLDFSHCEMTSVEPLFQVSQGNFIKSLNLEGNMIYDIKPMSTMTSLRELNIKNNKIEDLGPLATLKLKTFQGEGNLIRVCPQTAASKVLREFCKAN